MDPSEIAQVAGAAMPYLTATVAAYGTAVLDKARDQSVDAAADLSVGLGRRLLARLIGRPGTRPALEEAVQDAAANPGDEDFTTAMKAALRKTLQADPDLAAAVRGE